MGFRAKLCLFVLFSFAIFCSARNTFSFSGDETALAADRRSLMASVEDYDESTANYGHDPPCRSRASGGNGDSRRG